MSLQESGVEPCGIAKVRWGISFLIASQAQPLPAQNGGSPPSRWQAQYTKAHFGNKRLCLNKIGPSHQQLFPEAPLSTLESAVPQGINQVVAAGRKAG